MIVRIFSFLLLSILLPSFLFSCSSKRKQEAAQQQKGGQKRPPLRADAFIVQTKVLADQLEIPGSLVANQTTEIHPEVSGRITGIYFREGVVVGKGTLLVKLNDADLQAQKRKLLVQLQVAKQNENRSEQLLKIQGISRQDYETQVLQVSNVNADLAVIQTQIEKTNIRAPFSGKIGLRMVSVGAFVSPTTTVSTISQLDQMRIDFTVPEKYSREITNGQYVNFKTESSDRAYTARVMATESNITQDTRTLMVRAVVQGNSAGLVPGSFAKVTLNFEPDRNAIVIPTQAVIPQARGKKVYVFNNGKAKIVDVTTGIRDSSNVQITSGLKAGDTILITGLLAVKPDGPVALGKVVNGSTRTSKSNTGGSGDSMKVTQ
ncbi:MAG: efflux RND transporter periplasmic adaptor subunit [Flavisolibacter sp.]